MDGSSGNMLQLKQLISSHEDWLMKRLFHYAFERNYAEGTAAVEEAWRNCVAGLSAAILEGIDTIYPDFEFGPDHDFRNDPLCTFIVGTAKRHRERGVSLPMFHSLMVYYKEAWLDLVRSARFDLEYESECLYLITRMFDRFMISLCAEWAANDDSTLIEELQVRNRETIIEKNRFLTIFESVPNPLFIINDQRQIVNFNFAAALMLNAEDFYGLQYYYQESEKTSYREPFNYEGLTQTSSIIGQPVASFFPWLTKDLDAFISGSDSSVSLEKEVVIENESRYFNIKFSRRFDVSKTFVGGVIIFEDITEKKQVEKGLREAREAQRQEAQRNETRLNSILNILQHSSYSVTEFLDYALDEAIKLTESKIGFILHYVEDKREFHINSWSKGALKDCSMRYRPSVYLLDNTGIWGEVIRQRKPIIINDYDAPHPRKKGYPEGHAPIHRFLEIPVYSDKSIVGVVAVANKESDYDQTDILQLSLLMDSVWKVVNMKVMEEALFKSEEKYRTVFETTGSATIIMAENTTITLANEEFCALFGYSRTEIEGKTRFIDFIRANDIDAFMGYVQSRQERPEDMPGNYECQAVDRQGRIIDLLVSIASIQGARNSVVSMLNISERKRTEIELYKAHKELIEVNQQLLESNTTLEKQKKELAGAKDKAEAANNAKSAFLANMSHELRTPLNAILGYSHLIMRDSSLTQQQLGYLNTINRSGEYLLALINEVLELSKIEARHTTVDPGNFDLQFLIYDLENIFRMTTKAKGLELNMVGIEALPRHVIVDALKLRQILSNLLENAIKYTDQGSICLRAAAYFGAQDNIRLIMEVEDTGMGIAEEEFEQLFKYFEQTASGRQSQRGTGLGLAISREYARLMGGDITVTSQVGKGSTFHLEVDARLGKDTEMTEGTEKLKILALAPGKDPVPRILVAEDQKESRELLHRLLEITGFEVKEAVNGIEAVEIFEQWQPHFIWMDVRMPGINGLEATRIIKAAQHGPRTKIVALTASAMEEEKEIFLAAGCDDFVRKPFREDEILEVMAQHLNLTYQLQDARENQTLDPVRLKYLVEDLDLSLRNRLYEAVLKLDTNESISLIEKISVENPVIGQHLKNLADMLDYDGLLELLEKAD